MMPIEVTTRGLDDPWITTDDVDTAQAWIEEVAAGVEDGEAQLEVGLTSLLTDAAWPALGRRLGELLWRRPTRVRVQVRSEAVGQHLLDGVQSIQPQLDACVSTRTPAGCSVLAVAGDLVRWPAGMIVNPSNRELVLGHGVSGAIRAMARPGLQQEMARHAPLGAGEVVVTGSHGLPMTGWIAHAATLDGHDAAIRTGVVGAMAQARRHGAWSLAVPLLGAGSGGRSPAASADQILDALWSCEADTPGRVYLVAWEPAAQVVLEERVAARAA